MKNELQKATPTSVTYALASGDNITLDADTVKNFLTNGNGQVSDKEVAMYVQLCKSQQLNPFLKEAYLIKYSNNTPASIVVSKDAFIKRAEAHPQYDGMKSGIIVMNKEGKVTEREGAFRLPNESVVGGWARVFRKDKKTETYDSVSYEEYAVKDSNGNINTMWRTKPATMIQKVAEVHALRKAFPERLSGMYVEEETDRAQVISTMPKDNEQGTYDLSGMNEIHEPETKNEEFEPYTNTFEEDEEMDAYMDEIADKYEEEEEEPQPIEIKYSEYTKNKSNYKLVAGSYNSQTKTCKVYIK